MPRVLAIVVFLLLAAEGSRTYSGLVSRPLGLVEDVVFRASLLKIPLWTYAQVAVLMVLGTGPWPSRRARPMDLSIFAGLSCVVLWIVLGMARGGGFQDCGFQTLPYIDGLVLALLIMAVMRTPEHYGMLLDAIVAAAMYRAAMAIGVYVFIARGLPPHEAPDCMTTHDDSALFVTGLVIVLAGAALRATPGARRRAWILAPILLTTIYLNDRRVAWISLLAALAAAYAVFPSGAAKRRVRRAAAFAIPILAVYACVGWGRPEPMFKPLVALSSMSSRDDSSTRARDNENDGLVYTLTEAGPLGTGFGQEYTETDTSLSARSFVQYRIVPHNSILGLLAFTGVAGFIGIMLPLAISVFLNARTSRAAAEPIACVAAIAGVAEVAICMNQMYGDMGFGSRTAITILATAFATAGRLSAWTGAFPAPAREGRPAAVKMETSP